MKFTFKFDNPLATFVASFVATFAVNALIGYFCLPFVAEVIVPSAHIKPLIAAALAGVCPQEFSTGVFILYILFNLFKVQGLI